MRTSDLVKFIRARERHRIAKERNKGAVRPEDPIISKYRFCNVRRNDDRVTKFVLGPYAARWGGHEWVWFTFIVARLLNNEPALNAVADFVLPFKPDKMRAALHARKERGVKNFSPAYIVSTNGRSMDKVDYIIDVVLRPIWEDRRRLTLELRAHGTLAHAHAILCAHQGLGSFMAAQVLADWKYVNPSEWVDFSTFAASGPGSKRGLNRLIGEPTDAPCNETKFVGLLAKVRDAVNGRLTMEPLTAQDVQNCLCEFDKYERVRLGEGEPKQLYKPLKPGDFPWE